MATVDELIEYKKTVDEAEDKLNKAKSALKKFYNGGNGDLLKELNSKILTGMLDVDEKEKREMLVKLESVLQRTAIMRLEVWQGKCGVFQEIRVLQGNLFRREECVKAAGGLLTGRKNFWEMHY
ncbi:9954_t:CDS:1 [Paraglomus brasilianum]|uniref:9954_t:CDS:1 n=1 Tax=Paraglomus brasilianum TaxID=144538 RepID=A0A9N9F460_9GLOM|nr:9954_t:CDS:1 [Paraglomus brasilianum]